MKYSRPIRKSRNQRERCDCGGYHFPHRRGGGACFSNPMGAWWDARRRGVDDETLERIYRECLENN